jgi:DNA-binding MarR family transcriptional regulator
MESRYELISAAVSSMYHDIQKIERVEMATYGLKGPHAQCLLVMHKHPEGITAARLCEACEKDKAAVSRILAEMESAGLICKSGSAYRTVIQLTERGEEAAQFVSKRATLAVEIAGKGLTDGTRAVFYESLGMISANLQAMATDGLPRELSDKH